MHFLTFQHILWIISIVDLTLSAFLITSFQRIGKYNLLIRCHNGFIKLFYTHEVVKGCVGAVLGLLIVCINITSMLLTFQCVEVTTSIYEYHTSIINLPNLHYRKFEFYIHVFYWKYIYIPHDQPRTKSRFTQSAKLMMIVDIISKSNKSTFFVFIDDFLWLSESLYIAIITFLWFHNPLFDVL